ncbi:glycosyltransferase family 2 protein [Thalassotalea mangrovi]|uniref:Glycosyltransferase n=1 Tax=Thalassotalea mangrovi TaxID=2572245 RepID=A0A4U1B6E1_9GAMM|nr:glycosyltransferase [Thalassotalea mangrovi]TKB46104.1 glycosyltransferase [Thalassotalea mangrovi]
MNKNIFDQAQKLYFSGKYKQALEKYELAANKYGEELVHVNILLCKKQLGQDVSLEPYHDDITRLMLANSGDIKLDRQERANLINHLKTLHQRKSEDVPVKPVNPIPGDWPKDLELQPLPDSTNDFIWKMKNNPKSEQKPKKDLGLSVIIPTFNRLNILDITLACLVNQITDYPFEVIVADDGSQDAVDTIVRKYEDKLDIKYVRQRDNGYQLCAVRNLGMRTAKYDFVSILDCDMAPNRKWVQSYMELLEQSDDVALIGPRKYIDTNGMSANQFLAKPNLISTLPEVITNNVVAGTISNQVSVDWRLSVFEETEQLRLCDSPFRYFSGGNVAFAKKWLEIAGWFDEEFTHWGGEDNEFGYRLYKHGCFFRSVDGGMAYHQEPPGKENETDRADGKLITSKLVAEKVPYFYRKIQEVESAVLKRVPLVSFYIPAYNCEDYIERCVDSALNQTVTDIEVCICDDGSTDNTLKILKARYGSNPRVRIMSQQNGGIAKASNSAVKMCRGYYIAQLDSDDYVEPDAVELCLNEFMKDHSLACVYTTNRNVDGDGNLIANGYNWPEFSREKLTTAMILHHFRMFTARAWYLTSGFDETIENAVDYDMYLKISEVGPIKHINKISYNRTLHGENTSIKKLGKQKENHFKVVNKTFERQGINQWNYHPLNIDDDACRKYLFKKQSAELL